MASDEYSSNAEYSDLAYRYAQNPSLTEAKDGHQIVKDYSNSNIVCIVNNSASIVTFAIRGTQPKGTDLIQDLFVIASSTNVAPRTRALLTLVKRFLGNPMYFHYYVNFTGHSLGGTLAFSIAQQLFLEGIGNRTRKVILFNPFTGGNSKQGPYDFTCKIFNTKTCKSWRATRNICVIYKVNGDPLSLYSEEFGTVKKVPLKIGLNAHTMDNFL